MPIIEDAETGERIPKYPGGGSSSGGSSGGINIGDAIGAGKAIWNAETGTEVIQIGAEVWSNLSPEQKRAILNALKKVAIAAPVVIGKSVHHLQYLKDVPRGLKALGKVFGGGSSRNKTSKSKVINSPDGQFTIINKPSPPNNSPRNKKPQEVILF